MRGIGRYVSEFAGAIERSARASSVAAYVVNPDLPITAPLREAIAPDRLQPSNKLALGPGDVYHVTSPFEDVPLERVWPTAARADSVRLAVTVYDLIPLVYPEHYLIDSSYRARYENRLALIRLADRVLAISQATARDALEKLALAPSSIVVAGTGVSAHFHPPAPGEDPLALVQSRVPNVRPGYLLYTGALDFRKNVDALLVAYSRLPRALRARHQLLLVSRLSTRELDALYPRLRSLDLMHDVEIAREVDDDVLVPIYQAARLFVFPSLYEGFGLPVAEAIACGAPTIASWSSSLPEIVSEQSALFDPADPESLRATLERALTDPAERALLAAATLDPRHTWPSVAERSLDAYQDLAHESPSHRDAARHGAIGDLVAGERTLSRGPQLPPSETGLVRSLARSALWPARRFFDPRFAGLDAHMETMYADLTARMDRAFGQYGAHSLGDIERSIAQLRESIGGGAARNGGASGSYAIESAHALWALGRIQPGSLVLDISAPLTELSTTIAALGYEAAVLDTQARSDRPSTILTVRAPSDTPAAPAAVVCLGASGSETLGSDVATGALLVLTAPFGAGGLGTDHLAAMLARFREVELRFVRRTDRGIWVSLGETEARDADASSVVLVAARRSDEPSDAR